MKWAALASVAALASLTPLAAQSGLPTAPTSLQISDGNPFVTSNLALGKSFQMSPAPNYSLTADAGDATQLTDGQYVSGYFWVQSGAVGWEAASLVTVTIDLGESKPIGGISFNTAARTDAGVGWPAGILVLVSDDGASWKYAGDLVALSGKKSIPPLLPQSITNHRYSTMELSTRGRFVKVAVVTSNGYAFVDEIEVYSGPPSLMTVTPAGPSVNNLDAFVNVGRVSACLRRRLRYDLSAVADQLTAAALSGSLSDPLRSELRTISETIPSVELTSINGFSTVFPINDLHRRIFAVQAAIWRAKGMSGVILSQSNRWDMLSPTGAPTPGNPSLSVPMMTNEYRADAFNISNASETDARVMLSVQDLPGDTTGYVRVFDVPFTDTQSGVPVATALIPVAPQAGRYEITVPPGLTRQVWITFHPTTLSAGTYTGKVLMESSAATRQIPIQLKIYPFRFPDQPTLHLGGWDYTDRDQNYELTANNRDALIRTLREHFVDSPWATPWVFGSIGSYDSSGNMIQPPDSTLFDTWIARWPGARNYGVFADVHSSFAGFAMGSAAFKKAVADWINWWVQHLAQRNIQPQQLNIQLVDEAMSTQQDQIIIEYAKVIHQAQPNVVVWVNPLWPNPSNGTPGMYEAGQVLCPHLPGWIDSGNSFANFYSQWQQSGRKLWFYSVSSQSRLLDPYAFHRLQHWFCWKHGATGSAFWSFIDSSGSSSWNEYASQLGAYTPLFLDSNTVTESKHLEAIREGVEDYEYLRLLRDRIQQLGSSGNNPALASATTLLQTAANTATSNVASSLSQRWSAPKDRSVADRVRVDILNALNSLATP